MDEENIFEEPYYCTECGVEVKFEDAVCPKCGADLSETIDEIDGDLIVLKVFNSEVEAKMASDILESEGVITMISADGASGMTPNLAQTQGVRLLVTENNLEKAMTVLKAMGMF